MVQCEWCTKEATHSCPCGEVLCDDPKCEYEHAKDEVENPYT